MVSPSASYAVRRRSLASYTKIVPSAVPFTSVGLSYSPGPCPGPLPMLRMNRPSVSYTRTAGSCESVR